MNLFKHFVLKLKRRIEYWDYIDKKETICKQIGISPNLIQLPYNYNISGGGYIRMKGHFTAGEGLRMECIDKYAGEEFTPYLEIGNGVVINRNCHIGCINKIVIGDNVLLGSGILITDHSHGFLNDKKMDESYIHRKLLSKGPIYIGDNSWIGENACIMPNVSIGKGCIIGANSVVTHNIPDHSVAVGAPAKIIKSL